MKKIVLFLLVAIATSAMADGRLTDVTHDREGHSGWEAKAGTDQSKRLSLSQTVPVGQLLRPLFLAAEAGKYGQRPHLRQCELFIKGRYIYNQDWLAAPVTMTRGAALDLGEDRILVLRNLQQMPRVSLDPSMATIQLNEGGLLRSNDWMSKQAQVQEAQASLERDLDLIQKELFIERRLATNGFAEKQYAAMVNLGRQWWHPAAESKIGGPPISVTKAASCLNEFAWLADKTLEVLAQRKQAKVVKFPVQGVYVFAMPNLQQQVESAFVEAMSSTEPMPNSPPVVKQCLLPTPSGILGGLAATEVQCQGSPPWSFDQKTGEFVVMGKTLLAEDSVAGKKVAFAEEHSTSYSGGDSNSVGGRESRKESKGAQIEKK